MPSETTSAARVSAAEVEAQLSTLPQHWRWLTPKRTLYVFAACNLLNYIDREIIPGAPLQFEEFVRNTHGVPCNKESVYIGYFTIKRLVTKAMADFHLQPVEDLDDAAMTI